MPPTERRAAVELSIRSKPQPIDGQDQAGPGDAISAIKSGNGPGHTISSTSATEGLTGMVVVPLTNFIECGTIPRRSSMGQGTDYHVSVSELSKDDKAILLKIITLYFRGSANSLNIHVVVHLKRLRTIRSAGHLSLHNHNLLKKVIFFS